MLPQIFIMIRISTLAGFFLLFLLAGNVSSQQSADPQFKPVVDTPAYSKNYPRVLFDEAHYNAETVNGRYKPFADLLFSDGYHVVSNRKPFTKESLHTFKVLVIVNPLGADDIDDEGADAPAFTPTECEVVTKWVNDGGSVLLILDPGHFAAAAELLATKLEVEMNKGTTTDAANSDKESNDPSVIVYSRENQLLTAHSITSGRSEAERVSRVMTFTGQSLKGRAGSEPFLKLADTATDIVGSPGKSVSATGRAQGIAYRLGKGRVVVLGDAAMLSAQVTGSDNKPFGMNTPDVDNKQLALNIMHWLTGLLK